MKTTLATMTAVLLLVASASPASAATKYGNVHGEVWLDKNGDRKYQSSEKPCGGCTVTIYADYRKGSNDLRKVYIGKAKTNKYGGFATGNIIRKTTFGTEFRVSYNSYRGFAFYFWYQLAYNGQTAYVDVPVNTS